MLGRPSLRTGAMLSQRTRGEKAMHTLRHSNRAAVPARALVASNARRCCHPELLACPVLKGGQPAQIRADVRALVTRVQV